MTLKTKYSKYSEYKILRPLRQFKQHTTKHRQVSLLGFPATCCCKQRRKDPPCFRSSHRSLTSIIILYSERVSLPTGTCNWFPSCIGLVPGIMHLLPWLARGDSFVYLWILRRKILKSHLSESEVTSSMIRDGGGSYLYLRIWIVCTIIQRHCKRKFWDSWCDLHTK